jgi:hypothetical protein
VSPDEIKHFLVICDPATGGVVVEGVGNDYGSAQAAYAKQTHSSYFNGKGQRLEELLPVAKPT